jgi:hypothetical protein
MVKEIFAGTHSFLAYFLVLYLQVLNNLERTNFSFLFDLLAKK